MAAARSESGRRLITGEREDGRDLADRRAGAGQRVSNAADLQIAALARVTNRQAETNFARSLIAPRRASDSAL
jgi:hypothetical protein